MRIKHMQVKISGAREVGRGEKGQRSGREGGREGGRKGGNSTALYLRSSSITETTSKLGVPISTNAGGESLSLRVNRLFSRASNATSSSWISNATHTVLVPRGANTSSDCRGTFSRDDVGEAGSTCTRKVKGTL